MTDVTVNSTPAAQTLVANTSKTILAANGRRTMFRIYNPLATPLFVREGDVAATTAAGGYDIVVPANGSYQSEPGQYKGVLRAICATAGDINVSESV
jgi:hypothetical protein